MCKLLVEIVIMFFVWPALPFQIPGEIKVKDDLGINYCNASLSDKCQVHFPPKCYYWGFMRFSLRWHTEKDAFRSYRQTGANIPLAAMFLWLQTSSMLQTAEIILLVDTQSFQYIHKSRSLQHLLTGNQCDVWFMCWMFPPFFTECDTELIIQGEPYLRRQEVSLFHYQLCINIM